LRDVAGNVSELTGRFDLEAVIGAGGMGIVLAARDRKTARRVAIKVLRDMKDLPEAAVTRMLREARVTSGLRSPHIVQVYEVGQLSSGSPYLVMEYLDGVDLALRLRMGPLAVSVAADVLIQACAAMAEAHQAGVVHRDLKPSNLFLVQDYGAEPSVKVLDFGIAREMTLGDQAGGTTLTESGVTVGSPGYMAPEQVRASAVDSRADVWALGVILYESLSGVSPFRGDHAADSLVRIVCEPHVPLRRLAPSIPEGLAGVVEMCLEKERDRRLASVVDLARGLAVYATPRSAARAPLPFASAPTSVSGVRTAGLQAMPTVGRTRPRLEPLAAPRMLSCADGVAVAEFGAACIVIWRAKVTRPRFELQSAGLAEVVRRHPEGAVFLCVIESTAEPPDDDLRQASVEMVASQQAGLKCIACVVEGVGFRSAISRLALSAMTHVFRGRTVPLGIFSQARAAATWMRARCSLDVESLTGAVEFARANLSAADSTRACIA
jgi:tRNA A-37 threonylcarbamoyl transferase component Bud32